ncbi:conserved hypothetical protein [Histoplasma capsulatum var. duboisii H88]|uniref:Uncharacterized protein n=1 Tax=Ajellomyces capsulatus (strain H88) TaxID=544711 RepID=F0UF72_AJEC8|nr:conserved hypothetical protein [Histoplasma capsulatum var. duboisii H88]
MQLSFASGLLMLAAACVASPAPANAPVARAAEPQVPGPGEYPGPYDFLGQTTGPWDCANLIGIARNRMTAGGKLEARATSPAAAGACGLALAGLGPRPKQVAGDHGPRQLG